MNTNHFIRDDNNLTLWKTFSHTCPLVVQYHSEPNQEAQKPWVDILFIDGDHSATAVKNDWALYSPLIRPGGFVVFDDYMDFQYSPEVHGAVNEIVATLDTTQWYVIGSPPHNPDEPEGSSFNEFVIYRRP